MIISFLFDVAGTYANATQAAEGQLDTWNRTEFHLARAEQADQR